MAQTIFWSCDWPRTGRTSLRTEWRLEVKMDTSSEEVSLSWGMKREWVYTEGMKKCPPCEPRYIYQVTHLCMPSKGHYWRKIRHKTGRQVEYSPVRKVTEYYSETFGHFAMDAGKHERILSKGRKRSKWGLNHTWQGRGSRAQNWERPVDLVRWKFKF